MQIPRRSPRQSRSTCQRGHVTRPQCGTCTASIPIACASGTQAGCRVSPDSQEVGASVVSSRYKIGATSSFFNRPCAPKAHPHRLDSLFPAAAKPGLRPPQPVRHRRTPIPQPDKQQLSSGRHPAACPEPCCALVLGLLTARAREILPEELPKMLTFGLPEFWSRHPQHTSRGWSGAKSPV